MLLDAHGNQIVARRVYDDPPPTDYVEIVRSFSYKLNCGNYESRDFFASQKASCRMEDAEETSRKLYDFCRREVLEAVREYRKLQSTQRQANSAGFESYKKEGGTAA